jgi:hypothetical protein
VITTLASRPRRSLPSATPPAHGAAPAPAASGVPGWLVALLAVGTGLTAANLYYAQPLLASLSDVFHIDTATAGGLITLTQVG